MTRAVAIPSPFPSIVSAERQTATAGKYFWDNSTRPENDSLIIQRTISGEAFLDADGRRYRIPPGKAFLFRHGERSSYGVHSDVAYELEWVAIHSCAGTRDLFERIRHDFGPVVRMAGNGEAARILQEVVRSFEGTPQVETTAMAELCYRLLLALFREQVADTRLTDPVAFGRHVIESRFRAAGNIKEWVGETGLSREHFTREFRRRYGETPGAYLRWLRLEHARLLARTSQMPVEELAPASGFTNVQTFRRAFRRQFGRAVGRERGTGDYA